jgi:hypothetical protein
LIFVTQDNSPGSSLLVLKERSEMNQTFTFEDDDAELLAGLPASSLPKRPPLGIPVIQIRAYRRPIGSEEASSPDDDVPVSIGELAVKLVAEWSLPRMRLLGPPGGKGDPSAR